MGIRTWPELLSDWSHRVLCPSGLPPMWARHSGWVGMVVDCRSGSLVPWQLSGPGVRHHGPAAGWGRVVLHRGQRKHCGNGQGHWIPPSSGKRKRVDSVVTSMPAGSTGGKTLQRPAWLSGGIGSYSMGRGGGHGQRGWNPNWRGPPRSRSRSRYGRRGRQWRWWSEVSLP
jgi:hypothetical protein